MNKIRSFKHRTSPEDGIFNKITKRYSNVSSKLMRKSPGRSSTSPQKTASGSYDMTGNDLEEYKMEIGAPILISTRTLDTDRLGYCKNPTQNNCDSKESTSTTLPDAVTVQQPVYDVPKRRKSITLQKNRSKSAQNLHKSELRVYLQKAPSLELNLKLTTADLENCYDLPRNTEPKSHSYAEKRAPSPPLSPPPPPPPPPPPILSLPTLALPSTSLPTAAPKIVLNEPETKEAESLKNNTKTNLLYNQTMDELTDKLRTLVNQRRLNQNRENRENRENIKPIPILSSSSILNNGSEPNTPLTPEITNDFIKRTESLQDNLNGYKISRFSSNLSINHETQNSIGSKSSLEDFDLMSASCQSLNNENPFLTIEELNDIAQQIRDSEDIKKQLDIEYSKPHERKIRNKINLHHNKEKLNHAWSGVKHWIGEERGRIKKVVQKHAAMQRVGVNGKNFSTDSHSNTMMMLESRINISRTSSQLSKASSRVDVEADSCNDLSSCGGCSSNKSSTHKSSSDRTIVGGKDDDCSDNINDIDENDLFNKSVYQKISPFSKTTDSKEKWKGQNGFEELRRYIKQGGDFGKDLMGILQERVDSEQLYAKSLSKMASKLSKACREIPGTIADAWRGVAAEMEGRSEVHRQFANSLVEEIVKPLKLILDSEHKTRKTIENNVDKSARILSDWRITEGKAKKASHSAARENEKLQDVMLDVRIQKSPSIALLQNSNGLQKKAAEKEFKNAEKDCVKLDNKRRKAEETVKRADVEYYTLCMRAEQARIQWEMTVLRGSSILQNLENLRLINMKNYVGAYLRLTTDMNPILERIVQDLVPHINACNIQKDINVVKNIRKALEGPSEQLLPDFYCEHTTLAMNRERRKHALIKLLQLVKADVERERHSRNALKGLSQTISSKESQNITDKLYQIRSMLTYLEGARFKLHSALLELDHMPKNTHPLAPYIQVTRDRTGLQQSILKVPYDKMNNEINRDNDYELESRLDNNCIDIKNSTKNNCIDINNSTNYYYKNFNRSKSSSEITRVNGHNGQQQYLQLPQLQASQQQLHHQQPSSIVCESPKAQTLPGVKDVDGSLGFDRGIADGGSNQPDSDFDEFSSADGDDDNDDDNDDVDHNNVNHNNDNNTSNGTHKNDTSVSSSLSINGIKDQTDDQNHVNINSNIDSITSTTIETTNYKNTTNKKPIVISRCKALYSYTPKLYDELELNPGDIIEVHAKQGDGWWLGALNNQIGIFPATYVEELFI